MVDNDVTVTSDGLAIGLYRGQGHGLIGREDREGDDSGLCVLHQRDEVCTDIGQIRRDRGVGRGDVIVAVVVLVIDQQRAGSLDGLAVDDRTGTLQDGARTDGHDPTGPGGAEVGSPVERDAGIDGDAHVVGRDAGEVDVGIVGIGHLTKIFHPGRTGTRGGPAIGLVGGQHECGVGTDVELGSAGLTPGHVEDAVAGHLDREITPLSKGASELDRCAVGGLHLDRHGSRIVHPAHDAGEVGIRRVLQVGDRDVPVACDGNTVRMFGGECQGRTRRHIDGGVRQRQLDRRIGEVEGTADAQRGIVEDQLATGIQRDALVQRDGQFTGRTRVVERPATGRRQLQVVGVVIITEEGADRTGVAGGIEREVFRVYLGDHAKVDIAATVDVDQAQLVAGHARLGRLSCGTEVHVPRRIDGQRFGVGYCSDGIGVHLGTGAGARCVQGPGPFVDNGEACDLGVRRIQRSDRRRVLPADRERRLGPGVFGIEGDGADVEIGSPSQRTVAHHGKLAGIQDDIQQVEFGRQRAGLVHTDVADGVDVVRLGIFPGLGGAVVVVDELFRGQGVVGVQRPARVDGQRLEDDGIGIVIGIGGIAERDIAEIDFAAQVQREGLDMFTHIGVGELDAGAGKVGKGDELDDSVDLGRPQQHVELGETGELGTHDAVRQRGVEVFDITAGVRDQFRREPQAPDAGAVAGRVDRVGRRCVEQPDHIGAVGVVGVATRRIHDDLALGLGLGLEANGLTGEVVVVATASLQGHGKCPQVGAGTDGDVVVEQRDGADHVTGDTGEVIVRGGGIVIVAEIDHVDHARGIRPVLPDDPETGVGQHLYLVSGQRKGRAVGNHDLAIAGHTGARNREIELAEIGVLTDQQLGIVPQVDVQGPAGPGDIAQLHDTAGRRATQVETPARIVGPRGERVPGELEMRLAGAGGEAEVGRIDVTDLAEIQCPLQVRRIDLGEAAGGNAPAGLGRTEVDIAGALENEGLEIALRVVVVLPVGVPVEQPGRGTGGGKGPGALVIDGQLADLVVRDIQLLHGDVRPIGDGQTSRRIPIRIHRTEDDVAIDDEVLLSEDENVTQIVFDGRRTRLRLGGNVASDDVVGTAGLGVCRGSLGENRQGQEIARNEVSVRINRRQAQIAIDLGTAVHGQRERSDLFVGMPIVDDNEIRNGYALLDHEDSLGCTDETEILGRMVDPQLDLAVEIHQQVLDIAAIDERVDGLEDIDLIARCVDRADVADRCEAGIVEAENHVGKLRPGDVETIGLGRGRQAKGLVRVHEDFQPFMIPEIGRGIEVDILGQPQGDVVGGDTGQIETEIDVRLGQVRDVDAEIPGGTAIGRQTGDPATAGQLLVLLGGKAQHPTFRNDNLTHACQVGGTIEGDTAGLEGDGRQRDALLQVIGVESFAAESDEVQRGGIALRDQQVIATENPHLLLRQGQRRAIDQRDLADCRQVVVGQVDFAGDLERDVAGALKGQ